MKRTVLVVSAILLLAMASSAFAMTGTLVNGEPPVTELGLATNTTISTLHDETVDNEFNWYKGWWWVNLTNNTTTSWASVTIKPGEGDKVALVQGNGLVDEWGFLGNSVVANKGGSFAYAGPHGSRTYENDAFGLLWSQAVFTFATPLAPGGKVGFKIYTDNSWYTGTPASSFSMTLTPTAVPEPSSMLVLSSGLLGLGALVRRRR